jgi:lambda repressor-like predicted transcriptional regulator
MNEPLTNHSQYSPSIHPKQPCHHSKLNHVQLALAVLNLGDKRLRAAVSREAGLASSTLGNALARHWPKGKRLIAEALNRSPAEIWPSRYNEAMHRE